MKIWFGGAVLLVTLTALLTACSPFVFSALSLEGKTITYDTAITPLSTSSATGTATTSAPNGHNSTTLTFNNSGTGGTFETQEYIFNQPTASDASTGVYSKETWYQAGGWKGTFKYDPASFSAVFTYTQEYAPNPGATVLSTGYYASSDYSYQSLATLEGDASYSEYDQLTVSFTQNNLESVYAFTGTGWMSTINANVLSTSSSGTTTTVELDGSETYTIQSSSFVDDQVSTTTTTVGSGTPSVLHFENKYIYAIDKYFLVGGATGGQSLSQIWTKGNTVSFQLEQTEHDQIQYTGSTAPTRPTVNSTTGTGLTGTSGTPPFYSVSEVGGTTTTYNLANEGSYLLNSSYNDVATRHLAK